MMRSGSLRCSLHNDGPFPQAYEVDHREDTQSIA